MSFDGFRRGIEKQVLRIEIACPAAKATVDRTYLPIVAT
jgi:hypothetical protein